MFLLGVLSLLQLFLPGYLALQRITLSSLLTRLILSFGLSLLINYQFVLITTSLGIYGRWIVLAFVGVELLILLGYQTARIGRTKEVIPDGQPESIILPEYNVPEWVRYFFVGAVGVVGLVWLGRIISENPGIFNSWDDVVSWNRWATEGWYMGKFPSKTWHYPQLLPANWSMMYHIIGSSDIEFFVKAGMSLFPVFIIAVYVDLYRRSRSTVIGIGMALSVFMLERIVGLYVSKGYADLPGVFFQLGVIYCFILGFWYPSALRQLWLLAATFFSAALLTKQSGLLLLPVFAAFSFVAARGLKNNAIKTRHMIVMVAGLILICVVPWYTYVELRIRNGLEQSEVDYVTQAIFQGKGLLQRFTDGYTRFESQVLGTFGQGDLQPMLTIALTLLMGGTVIASLAHRLGRLIFITGTMPCVLIWGFYFSYDLRNLAPAIPFLAFSMAIGIAFLFTSVSPFIAKIAGASIAVVLVGWSMPDFGREEMTHHQVEMSIGQLGDSTLNRYLWRYSLELQPGDSILTAYEFARFLPGVDKHAFPYAFSPDNSRSVMAHLRDPSCRVKALVVPSSSAAEVNAFLEQVAPGSLHEVARTPHGWLFLARKSIP
jgi:hypothetical protein